MDFSLVWFGLAWFYCISTIIKKIHFYTYQQFYLKQFSLAQVHNVKNISISRNSVYSTKLNGFKYCYVSLAIQLNISNLFTHS